MPYEKVGMLIRNGDFLSIFSKRDELSPTPHDILCLNGRVVILPSLNKSALENLYEEHLGVEKMKSSARLTCWWPEINVDICHPEELMSADISSM